MSTPRELAGIAALRAARTLMEQLRRDMMNDLGQQVESWGSDTADADQAQARQAYARTLQTWTRSLHRMDQITNRFPPNA